MTCCRHSVSCFQIPLKSHLVTSSFAFNALFMWQQGAIKILHSYLSHATFAVISTWLAASLWCSRVLCVTTRLKTYTHMDLNVWTHRRIVLVYCVDILYPGTYAYVNRWISTHRLTFNKAFVFAPCKVIYIKQNWIHHIKCSVFKIKRLYSHVLGNT